MKDSENKKLERIQEIDRKKARREALSDELRKVVNGEGETNDKD